MGVSAPVTTFMAAVKEAGSDMTAGHWYYRITFINEDGFEGNPSTQVVEVTAGLCKDVLVSNIPEGSLEEAITHKRIYRTQNGGPVEGPYYLLDEIDNEGTTYTDTTPDSQLYPNTPPVDHDLPVQTCYIICRNGTRWILTGDVTHPLRIYYSKPSPYAEAWPLEYYIDMPDVVRAVCPLGNYTLILTSTTPFILQIDQEGNAVYQELPFRVPAESSWATLQWDNEAFWRGPLGLYRTNGITVQEDSESVRGLFPDDNEITTLAIDAMGRMLLTFNNYFVSANNGIIVGINDLSNPSNLYNWVNPAGIPTEVGTIRQMIGSEPYVFSAEYGRVVHIGGGGVGKTFTTLIRERRPNGISWGVSNQATIGISGDLEKKITYAAIPSGICEAYKGSRLPWQWKSVASFLGQPGKRKRLTQLTLYIKGVMVIEVWGDGVLLHTYNWPADFMDYIPQGGFLDTPYTEWNDTQRTRWERYVLDLGLQVVKITPTWDTWAYTYQIKLTGAAESQAHLPVQFFYELEKTL